MTFLCTKHLTIPSPIKPHDSFMSGKGRREFLFPLTNELERLLKTLIKRLLIQQKNIYYVIISLSNFTFVLLPLGNCNCGIWNAQIYIFLSPSLNTSKALKVQNMNLLPVTIYNQFDWRSYKRITDSLTLVQFSYSST